MSNKIIDKDGKSIQKKSFFFLFNHQFTEVLFTRPCVLDLIGACRKHVFRTFSRAENNWNARKRKGKCSSKYKGVCWFRVRKKWQARIQVNGKGIFLGIFEEEIDAAKAYDAAARKYYGEFAYLNFKSPHTRGT